MHVALVQTNNGLSLALDSDAEPTWTDSKIIVP